MFGKKIKLIFIFLLVKSYINCVGWTTTPFTIDTGNASTAAPFITAFPNMFIGVTNISVSCLTTQDSTPIFTFLKRAGLLSALANAQDKDPSLQPADREPQGDQLGAGPKLEGGSQSLLPGVPANQEENPNL